jgi:hypothetical protein
MPAEGVQIVGMKAQAAPRVHEGPRDPRGLEPEKSVAFAEGILNGCAIRHGRSRYNLRAWVAIPNAPAAPVSLRETSTIARRQVSGRKALSWRQPHGPARSVRSIS